MTQTHQGSCLCGQVRLLVAGPLGRVIYCHCGQCRKQTGHFYAGINVDEAALRIEGGEHVAWYRSSPEARRGFCRHCGSTLFWKADGLAYIAVLAGAFDGPTGTQGARHDFVAFKADYYAIADGLPQNDTFPPGPGGVAATGGATEPGSLGQRRGHCRQ